ncbi:hypothetical protein K505DRAFT_325214 [Melanomma pulvis-pyrius CBS 109.77]|uniref:Uncharacterized protein n=1 Tax=Melanomma pulvis-pyrius CBS 109.77 TaxID=1314802 RepID=A0A6A6XBM1_9PLEO|nr:hypothetical protein K505DRAFT_325214 [Melanomma pulvis-pyrius CBS 109.77]
MQSSAMFPQHPPSPILLASNIRTPLFFRLPLELRNQIYDILFEIFGPGFQFRQQDLLVSLIYSTSTAISISNPRYRTGLPLWILTCRQFLSEALSQFYHASICTSCVHTLGFLKRTAPTPGPRPISIPPSPRPKLLDLQHVRSAALGPIGVSSFAQFPALKPTSLYIFGGEVVGPLRDWLRSHSTSTSASTSLRHLKLTLTLPSVYPEVFNDEDWRVDLLATLHFPPVESARFVVRQERIADVKAWNGAWVRGPGGRGLDIRARQVVLPLLKRDVRGIAERLVGRGEFRCAVRDWTVVEGRDVVQEWKGRSGLIESGGDVGAGADTRTEAWEFEWHLDVRKVDVNRG